MNIPLDKPVAHLTVRELMEILDFHFAKKATEVTPSITYPLTKKVQVKALSSIYGWGESTIYGWCKKRIIPHYNVGREKWFDIDEIDKWIVKNKIRTQEEVISDFEQGKKFYSRKKS